MLKNIKAENFITKSNIIHGNKYDYSKVEYINNNTKVCVICPEHGEFKITPQKHLSGQGCRKCAYLKNSKRQLSNTEDFIEKAKKVRGNKYDYSKVRYVGSQDKVCIICPEHGEFWQTPNSHLNGRSCRKCSNSRVNLNNTSNTEDFIEKSKEVHGDRYDYSFVKNIKNKKEKIPIICPDHGVFYKSYEKHVRCKQGCPECSGKKRYTNEEFITKCKKLEHTKNFDFSETTYINNSTKVKIFCKCKDDNGVEHGDFLINPGHLLSGQGCPKCRYIKSASKNRRTINEVISSANEVHKNKYDYSLIEKYKNDRIKYPIICPEHGVFYQTLNNHIKAKQGCPICGRIKSDESRRYTFEDFASKAQLVHNGKYEYNDNNYIGTSVKIGITCKKHGVFYMEPGNHLAGQGCPKCAFVSSKGEKEVFEFIKCIVGEDNVSQHDRNILKGEELDIFIPSVNLAIEYNGLYWHSEISKDKNYHLNKTNKCNNSGITLFHIFEDEWAEKKEIVKSMLSLLLNNDIKIYSSQCLLKEVTSKESNIFLENNHIKGKCKSKIRYGLYYNNQLVTLMVFEKINYLKHDDNIQSWKLLRFCNKIGYNIIDGDITLFRYFIKNNIVDEVNYYMDMRYPKDNMYKNLGFTQYNKTKPNYYYIVGNKRLSKNNIHKTIFSDKYSRYSDKTEKDFCDKKKFYRIYDCGLIHYKWYKQK